MKELAALVAIVALVAAVVLYEVAKYNECRRVHPAWYCLSTGGK